VEDILRPGAQPGSTPCTKKKKQKKKLPCTALRPPRAPTIANRTITVENRTEITGSPCLGAHAAPTSAGNPVGAREPGLLLGHDVGGRSSAPPPPTGDRPGPGACSRSEPAGSSGPRTPIRVSQGAGPRRPSSDRRPGIDQDLRPAYLQLAPSHCRAAAAQALPQSRPWATGLTAVPHSPTPVQVGHLHNHRHRGLRLILPRSRSRRARICARRGGSAASHAARDGGLSAGVTHYPRPVV